MVHKLVKLLEILWQLLETQLSLGTPQGLSLSRELQRRQLKTQARHWLRITKFRYQKRERMHLKRMKLKMILKTLRKMILMLPAPQRKTDEMNIRAVQL
jgi:hypothetical protein